MNTFSGNIYKSRGIDFGGGVHVLIKGSYDGKGGM